METANNNQYSIEMDQLCESVKTLVMSGDYESGIDLIRRSMEQYPHSPQPHNLLGIILEKTGRHNAAIKHFKAALALDPGYLPAKYNLHIYGTFFANGSCAFDESDITLRTAGNIEIVFDSRNVGHAGYINVIEFDEYGIGHVVRK